MISKKQYKTINIPINIRYYPIGTPCVPLFWVGLVNSGYNLECGHRFKKRSVLYLFSAFSTLVYIVPSLANPVSNIFPWCLIRVLGIFSTAYLSQSLTVSERYPYLLPNLFCCCFLDTSSLLSMLLHTISSISTRNTRVIPRDEYFFNNLNST